MGTNHARAREIMGKNFFGVEEAIEHFGVNPTEQQLAALSDIPYPEAVLEQLKDAHILVAVFPISVIEIREKVDSELFYHMPWYNERPFAKESSEVSWQLVRKTPADDSFLKNWQEQQALIGEEDEVPTAQVMVYTIVAYYLTTGEHLLEHIYVRTSSVDSGEHVIVGDFVLNGLYINRLWISTRNDHLGVSSARKS
ncbi:hypothetical protein ACFL11_00195 [Patescibacteria group bacterium]